MTKYKLKKEARQFFRSDLHTDILPLERWAEKTIHENLLEKVDKVYVEQGIPTSEYGKTLKGWSSNDGNPRANFHFTVNILDIENTEYAKINTAEVMDEIQEVLNNYFKNNP